jgi:pyruvate kinase
VVAVTTNAKIVCTLGPASTDRGTIERMAEAGMAVARLNASHGTTAERRELVRLVREVDADLDRPLAVLLDLAGPEVRTAAVEGTVTLADGATITFAEGDTATGDRVGLSTDISAVTPGDRVLLDDGRIETTVQSVHESTVRAHVDSGGELKGRAGVNIPGVDLGLPAVTESDAAELDVAAEEAVDFVAASFVRSSEDIFELGGELDERGVDIPLIAKIERAGAVDNADDIIEAADGVMVARGDLGVECPLEDVPIIQKRLIRKSHRAGVPVITATEMLDSMIEERRPTRAEASDVANAVLDGTDAVMLSGETAVGNHPVEVVEMMDRIIRDVEGSEEYAEVREQRVPPADDTRTDALARSARYLARDVDASAIVAASESGYTARKAAKYRPNIPIVAATPSAAVRRQLTLTWGIIPQAVTYAADSADALISRAVQSAIGAGAVEAGDTVVVLAGMMTQLEGLDTANMLKVHIASERLTAGRSVVAGQVSGPLYRTEDGDLSDLPEGVVLAVPASFEGEFSGDVSKIAGIVDGQAGMTGYAAIVARELDVPMICDASVPDEAPDGRPVTLDAERGVLYANPQDGDGERERDGR